MMGRIQADTRRMDDLLGDVPQDFGDNTIRVERILLEMVRPDPVQPRRVLPESIHQRFHQNQITPTQALRELVQLVARQRGRPFNSVLELLPQSDRVTRRALPVSGEGTGTSQEETGKATCPAG